MVQITPFLGRRTNNFQFSACRNQERAEAAKKKLEEMSGAISAQFEILLVDMKDFNSVKSAVSSLNETIDGIILNAGGPGSIVPNKDGICDVAALNVTGNALLVDELLKSNKLTKGATVLYSSSEAVRGLKEMGMPQPALGSGTVEEIKDVLNGSKFSTLKNDTFTYSVSHAKLVGTLWASAMARKFQEIRFISISPGYTTGTNFITKISGAQKCQFIFMTPIMACFKMTHGPDVGAKRYLDVLYDFDKFESGKFYASANGLTGVICDQTAFSDILANEMFQDNAYEAIHSFF